MVKLNIFNRDHFLQTVNSCADTVLVICQDGNKEAINGRSHIQNMLLQKAGEGDCVRLTLDIPNPGDYMKIMTYYVGDC